MWEEPREDVGGVSDISVKSLGPSNRLACLSSDPYHRSTADALSHR